MPIEALSLSVRSANGLRSQGIASLGQLAALGAKNLLRTPNMGRKSVSEVREALLALGLELAS